MDFHGISAGGKSPLDYRSMDSHLSAAVFFGAIFFTVSFASAQQSGVQGTAEREVHRQEAMAAYAQGQLNKGTDAMLNHDYESAFAYFKSAVDALPSGGAATKAVRDAALEGFSRATVKLTEQRIAEGRFQDASSTIGVVLEERYNPKYVPALQLRGKLNDPNTYFRTLTPGFVSSLEEVKRLLVEAQGFYASGRYDLAQKRYEQVLNVDKYNIAARRGLEQVDNIRAKYASTAYSEARGDMIREVDKGWEMPVRKFDVGTTAIIQQPAIDTRGTTGINHKLDDIIIPRIEFHEATIREAVDFIKTRAAALDTTDKDPSHRGVNIVLELDPNSPEENARITLSLNDVPLRAAIDYVAKAANLKLKVEPFAVAIVPQSVPTDILITKEYKVPPGFISALPAASGLASAAAGGGGATSVAPGSMDAVKARSGAREFLEGQGVTFPPGASANFIASSSRLIVKNTQSNLDLIDTLVENSLSAPPTQVEIESKFIEVTQSNLKELGFDWLLGQFSLPFGSGVYGGGGTQGGSQSVNASSYPFVNSSDSSIPIGASSSTSGPITGGNRSGSTAITANAVDSLLFGSSAGAAPGILALAGVFTNPQFQVVLRALNQSKGVDLVSAPKVTTKSGQRATIEIVREFRYPAEYDLPQVTGVAGSVYTPATPTSPTSFDKRDVGITLEVEPTVGPDGYTIDLTLSPRVVEFEGFINYGSPINTTATVVGLGISANILVSANVINRPVFSSREVTTEVTVYDGQTVVLGGLMREDVQRTEDKVPIIGDIPLAGRLFRTSADQHIKRNLIMFVTADILDPAGQPLIKTDEENDIIAAPSATEIKQEAIPNDPLSGPTTQ